MFAALNKDGFAQFKGFVFVKLTLGKDQVNSVRVKTKKLILNDC